MFRRSIFLIPILALAACDGPGPVGLPVAHPDAAVLLSLSGEAGCEEAGAVRLLAGRTLDAGSIQVWSTDAQLHVRFVAGSGWAIGQTHLAVAADLSGIPRNGPGNPVPGRFPYRETHAPAVTDYTYIIDLSELGAGLGDELLIAAHAEVEHEALGTESAWGEGSRFVERGNWATYFVQTVRECKGDDEPGDDPPPPGRDVVVFNDIDLFSDEFGWDDPNNRQMTANLLTFSGSGPRADGNVIWTDRGRVSGCFLFGGDWCGSYISGFRPFMVDLGFTVQDFTDGNPAPLTSIPPEVKVIFLMMPRVNYSVAEINALKAFADEGGRVVFIGEHEGFYGLQGLAVENQFLINMGAVLRNTGGEVDCGGATVVPGSSLRPHQITTGLEQITVACASEIEPGPDDYPLFYDTSGTRLLGGVAVIDTTPLSALTLVETALSAASAFEGSGGSRTPSGR